MAIVFEIKSGAKKFGRYYVPQRIGDHGMDAKNQTRKGTKPCLCFSRNKGISSLLDEETELKEKVLF